MPAHSLANTIVSAHPSRELVITVRLPDDRGRHGDARPKVHRFRSHWLELGARLRAFRERFGLTQVEVAGLLGVTSPAVCQLGGGSGGPPGIVGERLADLLEGSVWPEVRATLMEGEGLPRPGREAARWYRGASRERQSRESAGTRLCRRILEDRRCAEFAEALRR